MPPGFPTGGPGSLRGASSHRPFCTVITGFLRIVGPRSANRAPIISPSGKTPDANVRICTTAACCARESAIIGDFCASSPTATTHRPARPGREGSLFAAGPFGNGPLPARCRFFCILQRFRPFCLIIVNVVFCSWRWMGPGGPRGLQSRCEARRTSRVCSIRTHLRQRNHKRPRLPPRRGRFFAIDSLLPILRTRALTSFDLTP